MGTKPSINKSINFHKIKKFTEQFINQLDYIQEQLEPYLSDEEFEDLCDSIVNVAHYVRERKNRHIKILQNEKTNSTLN